MGWLKKLWNKYLDWANEGSPSRTEKIFKSRYEYLDRDDVTLEHKFQFVMTTALSDVLPDSQIANWGMVEPWVAELLLAVEGLEQGSDK